MLAPANLIADTVVEAMLLSFRPGHTLKAFLEWTDITYLPVFQSPNRTWDQYKSYKDYKISGFIDCLVKHKLVKPFKLAVM